MRLALSLLCLGLLACTKKPTPTEKGTSTGPSTVKTVGQAGARVTSADGRLTLDIPMGALMADTEIGIEPITNHAPLGVGSAYRLTPDGTKFSQPVKLGIHYTESDYRGAAKEALALAFQDADGNWRRFAETVLDEASGTVVSETTHFTDFSMLLGWQLRPPTANVEPLGTVDLSLKYCEPENLYDPNSGDSLSGLVPRCDLEDPELPSLVAVNGWAVNGTPGGSLPDGAVSGMGRTGRYTAPGAAPARLPVAVSCDVSRGKGTALAVSNVNIGPGGWEGEITWQVMGAKQENISMGTRSWSASGNGKLIVRPGPFGLGEVQSATYTYSLRLQQQTVYNFMQAECSHSVKETRDESRSATVTMGASLTIDDFGGGNINISFSTPQGNTMGTAVLDSTDTVTGPASCVPPSPTHKETPLTGTTPSHAFTFAGTLDGKRLKGTTTAHFDGSPPHDYTISYDLSK